MLVLTFFVLEFKFALVGLSNIVFELSISKTFSMTKSGCRVTFIIFSFENE